ncbi:Phosphatidylinositide phosphatase SAC2 [Branchiostoma belcheri]|nr:Phosphatidylinositide phosphatase SAC2 [Branchiostoma belcheri]
METLGVIKNLVRPGDFMAKLDLKDAYFTIPVDADSRRFLTFQWQGRFYQFQCLPFGVATAPRVFTKVLKVPVAILRRRGFRLVVYLDDILVIGRSREACREALWAAIELLSRLGFVPNLEKSVLEPSQRITFLGSGIDTTQMVTFLPESKVLELQQLAHDVLTADRGMLARELASVIGRLQATTTSVWLAPLHFRSLQRLLSTVLRVTRGHWEQLVPLTESARADLRWWTDHLPRHNSRPILSPAAVIVVETDASTAGWGGYSNGVHTGGRWSVEEGQTHINILELRAASLTVRAFCRELVSKHVKVLTDNVTVVAYLNRLGGTRSQRLLDIALDLWEWCVNRDLYITAEHVPGKENVRADYNSRHFSPATEWTLDRHTFLGLQATFPRLMKGVDLFASDISTTHEGGGSVRVPNKLPATSVCVLASRARGNRDRCVHNELEQVRSAIRFSPVHASRTNSKESARRQSSPASRGSDLGHSSLVPSPAGHAGRRTSVTTSPQQSPDTARVRDASPRGHKNATSRLACLRSQHDMYGISPEVSKILLASWRAGTQKLYASAWDKWSGWCDQRHIHPVSAPLNKVLDFLISLYDKGFQYRTINDNVYRSAISTTHLPLEGQPLGSHPLMAKTVLQEAGIDTSRFTGHSTRGASVSAAARQRVSTKDILAAANWSTASTFKKFYNRPADTLPDWCSSPVLHEFRHDPSREGFGQVELKNFRLVRMRREGAVRPQSLTTAFFMSVFEMYVGDFTRTGERKLAGVLNDGYKSANRYYLSRFKDAYRQATIDMMLGNAVSEDLTVLQSSGREEELLLEEREDHVAQLIEHCKQLLLPGAEGCAGGWALIDCDPGSQLLEERLSQALEEEARADLSRLLPSTRTLNTNGTKAKSRSLNNLASDLEVVKENKAKVQLPEQEDGRKVQTEPGSSALTQTSLLSTISQDALSSLRPPESLQKLQDMIKQQFSEVPSRLQKYVGQSVTEETSQQNKDKSERNGQETKDDIRGGVGQDDAIVAENNQMVQNVGCEDVLNLGYQTVNKSLKDLIPQNFRQQVSKLPDKMQQLISQSQETLGEVMFGGDQSEDTSSKDSAEEQADDQGSLLGQVKRLLPLSGGSGTAGDGDLSQPDMDVILLLTQRAYYIAYYDEEAEKVTHYQRVNLEDLEKIELGPEPSVFKSRYYCMRVHHQYCGEVGYFHTLRSIGRGDDQSKGLLQAIADAFRAACEAEGHQIQVAEGKLDKRQTKPHEEIISISAQTRLSAWARTRFPRDHSADSISTVATVSQPTTRSFILSSVRNKISSFNPIRRVRAHTHARRVSLSKKSGGGIVYFQKGEESAGQADDEGANMSVRVTLSDSSSETESFDNLSLDDCEAILAGCSQNNNKRKSLQELIVTEADDLVLESCGILASSPPSSHTRIHIMAGKGEEGTQGEDYTTAQTASDLDTDIRTMTSVAIKVVAPQEEENGAQQQDGNRVEDGLPTPESQSCQSSPQKQQQQPDAGATDSKTPDREDSKKNTILEFFKPARKIFELSLSVDSKFSSSPTGAGAEDDKVVDGESKEEASKQSQTGEEEEIHGDRSSTEEQNLAITTVPQSESTSPLATDSETPGKLGVEEPLAVNSIAEPNASAENTDFIKLSPLTKFRSLFSPSDRDASPRRNGDRQQNRQVESLELRLKMKNCKTQIIQL